MLKIAPKFTWHVSVLSPVSPAQIELVMSAIVGYFCLHLASVNHGMGTSIKYLVIAPFDSVVPQPVATPINPAYEELSEGIQAGTI